VAAERGELVLLVKPQFEVGRGAVGSGGVVRDPAARRQAVLGVIEAAVELGLLPRGVMASPLPGPAGNVEFLLLVASDQAPSPAGREALSGAALDEALEDALRAGELLGAG
jgi:23S rRNA (cytidine1920-2'-O)/16S rRNA (cytidine1409-2'-O)-methyltransferase